MSENKTAQKETSNPEAKAAPSGQKTAVPGPEKTGKKKKPLDPDRVDLFPIFRTMYELLLEFEHAHEQFPKPHKFTVGKRISISFLQALEYVTEAIAVEERRIPRLADAIVSLEKARILVRVAHDLRAMDSKRYERFARLVVSATGQTGALIKVAKKRQREAAGGVGAGSSRN